MANEPKLSISRQFRREDDPVGKVFAFHLSIPNRIRDKPVRLHPDLPVKTEIVRASPRNPKSYCITAFCTEADGAEGADTNPIKIPELFWDKIEDRAVDVELEVRLLPARSGNPLPTASGRNLTAFAVAETTETTRFRTSSRYEDMPVDDP